MQDRQPTAYIVTTVIAITVVITLLDIHDDNNSLSNQHINNSSNHTQGGIAAILIPRRSK